MCKRSFAFFLSGTLLLSSCSVDPPLIEELPADDIFLLVPEGWPAPVHSFSEDPLTKDKFILGRRLFYDTRLSSDNRVSCGSCHQRASAFADEGDAFSFGVNAAQGKRNSSALFNLNWQGTLMWDGRFSHLWQQPVAPITAPDEMNETFEGILLKLRLDKDYPRLFMNAYSDAEITKENITRALAQFMGMLVSYRSRYDDHIRGKGNLSAAEKNGMALFSGKCAGCHPAPLFSTFQYANNGLDSIFADPGRAAVSHMSADSGKFKIPSLRNVALSGPYMHDGRFASLKEVLDHYSGGISHSSSLDTALNGGISLSEEEKQDIIAFLKTLSDEKFIRDRRFADPFTNQEPIHY